MDTVTAVCAVLSLIATVALLFGVIAAWHGLAELLPVIKQVWSPRGSAQSMAIVGAALAIIAGRA